MRYIFIAAGAIILLIGVVGFVFSFPALRHVLSDAAGIQQSTLGSDPGLSLHLVNPDVTLEEALANGVPNDSRILDSRDGAERYLVLKVGHALGPHIVDAAVSTMGAKPIVSFRFDTAGAKIFTDITSKNIGRKLAMVIDNKVFSAPVIQSPIFGGSGIITGSFTVEEAQDLARKLKNPG
ncbi:MAG: hypothetical protein GKS02_09485 [Alphaproteobacteria bacterium]|nr:hypothetical protein [Alphaproteobacteria bacterium]